MPDPQSTTASYARKYEASQQFSVRNTSAVAAAAYFDYDYTQDLNAVKYLPLNQTTVDNLSSARIRFYPNKSMVSYYLVNANSSRVFSEKEIPALYSFRAVNDTSATTIAANELTVTAQRVAIDTQRVVANTHAKLFGGR